MRMSGCELLILEGVERLRMIENGYRNVGGRQFEKSSIGSDQVIDSMSQVIKQLPLTSSRKRYLHDMLLFCTYAYAYLQFNDIFCKYIFPSQFVLTF